MSLPAYSSMRIRGGFEALRQDAFFPLRSESLPPLLAGVERYDRSLKGHLERVSVLCVRTGSAMGFEGKELFDLGVAALLHDIGKVAVPFHILNKPARLSVEEALLVQDHPVSGERIVRAFSFPETVCRIVRHHHERYDGKGYPDGLAGEEIPLGARILRVADAYDAVTEERPYRRAMARAEARRWMADLSGLHFDPEVVEHFLSAEAC